MKDKFILFNLFGCESLVNNINELLECEQGHLTLHTFPDQETIVRIHTHVNEREIVIISSLDNPNPKLFPLISVVETLRALGASKVILIAPYLPYMRQDKSFQNGEGITSIYFAKLISNYFDILITMDPHLHRWKSLDEIFNIPTNIVHATKGIATWIKENVSNPLIIGPDIESRQWISEVAKINHSPFVILDKIREGDRLVKISIPDLEVHQNLIPVLIDDIIASGITMIETIRQLKTFKMNPICIGIHGIFAGDSYNELLSAGAQQIVTCNTITHPSNQIDVSKEFVKFLLEILS